MNYTGFNCFSFYFAMLHLEKGLVFLMCTHGGKILNKKGDILGRTNKHTDSHLLALRVGLYKIWKIMDGSKP